MPTDVLPIPRHVAPLRFAMPFAAGDDELIVA